MIHYTIINLIVFLLYGTDKGKARRDAWRISERTLLVSALFGCWGALSGMLVFHHKTRKTKFRILVPLCCILHILLYMLFRSMKAL